MVKIFAFSFLGMRVSVSLKGIRIMRPGVISSVAGAFASSGEAVFSAATAGDERVANFGGAGGAFNTFGSSDACVFTIGGGGGTAVLVTCVIGATVTVGTSGTDCFFANGFGEVGFLVLADTGFLIGKILFFFFFFALVGKTFAGDFKRTSFLVRRFLLYFGVFFGDT